MITFLIGHRGSGKTTTLKILQGLKSGYYLDLDEEIEKRHGSIEKIFSAHGESAFRKIERETLTAVLNELETQRSKSENIFIALGAGFRGETPEDALKVWIRRESDEAGRVFLNRPALEPGLAPLDEWAKRFVEREKRYSLFHDDVLTLPEGEWLLPKVIGDFFGENLSSNHIATLLPEDFYRLSKKKILKEASLIEIREDFWTERKMSDLVGMIPPEKIYFSHRHQVTDKRVQKLIEGMKTDWDLNLGEPTQKHWSYSLHDREFTPAEEVKYQGGILKWAPEVQSFDELFRGHQWWMKDPTRRAFLPRSKDGRWRWYRRLFGPRMPIHFVRDYEGSAKDQPFLYEQNLQALKNQGFAAVLGGTQVRLSWSPSFHHDVFAESQMPFVAIPIEPHEFTTAVPVLTTLGLKAAAVTSPHKKMAFQIASQMENQESEGLKSLNTLYLKDRKFIGVNTDITGLRATKPQHKISTALQTVIWGGGGMLPVLKNLFPKALVVPARKGAVLDTDTAVVWSSLRSPETRWPEPLSKVKAVIDLNYSENSMGRELALKAGCEYVSGSDFFKEQGLAQQKFWRKYL